MRYVLNYFLLNVLCGLLPHPKLRARYLAVLGARIGRDVRIENVRFIQIQAPLSHLHCADAVFIGSGVTIDLSDEIELGAHAIVAPGCSLLTHQDFGHFNGNASAQFFPRKYARISVGEHAVVGCDSTVLAGSVIGAHAVVGAKSLVAGQLTAGGLFFGSPARFVRALKRE
jgi:acetyltransferase-like isoleucine patch superfamily enzyme